MPRQNDFIGGIEWSKYTKPILPHQMTPAQFREHPLAVHHGTTQDAMEAEDLGQGTRLRKLSFAGDKFQAADRIGQYTHQDSNHASLFPLDNDEHAGNVHHYWAVPTAHEAKNYFEDDDAPADAEGKADIHGVTANRDQLSSSHLSDNDQTLGYYRNIYEGADTLGDRGRRDNPGRPSVAMRNDALGHSKGFTTQSEFVHDAIARGKAHEVHPETMDLYKKGTLDTTPMSNHEISHDIYGVSTFISPQFQFNHEYYASSPYNREHLESAIDSKYQSEITPRSELPSFKDNKPLDMREIRNQVGTGYAARVRKTYRSLYARGE
jgi:hypothetical protein